MSIIFCPDSTFSSQHRLEASSSGWTEGGSGSHLSVMTMTADLPKPNDRRDDGAPDYDVLIVGGGMVGLTLAAALGGAGTAVGVVDRAEMEATTDPGFDGRASAIAAGSRAVLDAIGVWPTMARHAGPILEIRVTDGSSPLFLHYDSRELGDGPLGHIVENRHIRRALLDRLTALRSVRIIGGRSVVANDRGALGAAALLDDGTRLTSRLIVAADGRDSPLRQDAGIGVTGWSYDQSGIVCTVAHALPHRGIAQERFLAPGPFAILPMTGDRSSIVWTERSDVADRLMALDDAAFADELARRFGDYLGELSIIGKRFSYPLSLVHAERYIDDRLALIGDAAHGMHPIAGQGFNIGIRDIAALAEVVVDAIRLGLDPGATTVLERYQRWRRFDNTIMLAVTDGLNRLFSNQITPIRLVRDAGLAAVDRLPALKRVLMRHAMGQAGELPRLVLGQPL
jgi:2-octaprenyl-6-methoxyphenol hydroxylase